MLTKADDFPIHQTPDPIAFSGTDRNFYDRYFFNGTTTDGEVFFGAAMGIYPHLNIIDAAFSVRIADRQFNLHASRHLHMERMDTHVGPIRVEVIEPLQRLRVLVDENEFGISADLTFRGRHFPLEEPRTVRRNGPRIVQDVTRLTQLGRWSGWIRQGDLTITMEEATTPGTRDRSWGVRHVGMRDPQPPATPLEFQAYWFWLPAQFDDRIVHFYINEDGEGKSWNVGMVMIRDDGSIQHIRDARISPEFVPGTRFPRSATVTARDDEGGVWRIEVETGRRFFLTGLGYMNPDWSHGLNKGPLAVGYDEIATDDIVQHEAPYQHSQAFAPVRLTFPDGHVQAGFGSLESIIMGRHVPSGFTTMFAVP
ncbi:hypothetical protein [Novosphingobium sp.]|uniref:DUF7064 domain-containing protein n=1 Tax=Novosphingobium sp. TaxID=1874826 RepID=UPI00262196C9|nr:hypothetical protein [Novosphingobium sp.]